jgi:hypothetical protein
MGRISGLPTSASRSRFRTEWLRAGKSGTGTALSTTRIVWPSVARETDRARSTSGGVFFPHHVSVGPPDWAITANLAGALEAVDDDVGDAIRRSGGRDADYLGVEPRFAL